MPTAFFKPFSWIFLRKTATQVKITNMKTNPKVLICDDDSLCHMTIKQALKDRFECVSAYNGDEALVILKKKCIDVLILDVQMRTPDEGLRYLPKFKELDPDLAVIVSSGLTDFTTVREAMKLGATDYIPKNFDPNDLEHTLNLALAKRDLLKRTEQQNFEVKTAQNSHVMVGKSAAFDVLRKIIAKLQSSAANVVITGETGTGKEVVARQLRGVLADGSLAPFVTIDSSTIQNTMAESILFGHEKGAFTGAEGARKGIFEEANGGIVYFDEIANMPLDIQAKLLRVLQEKEVTRLGSTRPIQLDFRVVCATNKNLEKLSQDGQFKDDLLQRLNVIPVAIPPLHERQDDIPELLKHFAQVHAAGASPLSFTKEAVELLQLYGWPGNIRELGNLVSYLTTMADSKEIDVCDLPPKFRDQARESSKRASASATPGSTSEQRNFYQEVEDFEAELLRAAYQTTGGVVSKLALYLGMDRSYLHGKLKEYKIHPKS